MKQLLSDIQLILTLDCEGSARLTSDSMDRQLRWAERVAAFMHRLICGKSRRLHRQMVQLNASIHAGIDVQMHQDAMERIRKAIDEKQADL